MRFIPRPALPPSEQFARAILGMKPSFFWMADDSGEARCRVTGLKATGGGYKNRNGMLHPVANGSEYMTWPSNFGLGASGTFFFMALAARESVGPMTGAVARIGGATDGIAVGFGSTSFDTTGYKLVHMRDSTVTLSYSDTASLAGDVAIYLKRVSEGYTVSGTSSALSAFDFTGGFSAPSQSLTINGCPPSRGSNLRVYAAMLFVKTLNNNDGNLIQSYILRHVFRYWSVQSYNSIMQPASGFIDSQRLRSPLLYTGLTSASIRYGRPIADIATNGWASSLGGNLYVPVSEETQNDADYIISPTNPTTEEFEVQLNAVTDPGASLNPVVSVGLVAAGQDTTFTLKLVQGTTVLDTWNETVSAGSTVTRDHTVAGTITNFGDLRIRGVAHA